METGIADREEGKNCLRHRQKYNTKTRLGFCDWKSQSGVNRQPMGWYFSGSKIFS